MLFFYHALYIITLHMLTLEIGKNIPPPLVILLDGEVFREVCKSLFISELKKFPPEISRDDFLVRFALLEEKIGKRYALYLLSGRPLLSSDLEKKLLSKGLTPSAARGVVEWCRDKQYLDDTQEIARLVARELRKGQSARAVLFKLKHKKGISESSLREHLRSAAPSDVEALQRWMEKHARKIAKSTPAEKRKLMAKLCRLGFASDLVFKAFDRHYV